MDHQSWKREQILVKYEKLKKKVKDWENAIYKTEGRHPNKDDMKQAPREVQESYRNVVKLKKYLQDSAAHVVQAENSMKLLTPGKLFIGTRRNELLRSEPCYLTRSPSSSEQKLKVDGKYKSTKPSMGLRSFKDSGGLFGPARMFTKLNDSPKAPMPFKKLYKVIGDTQAGSFTSSSSGSKTRTSKTETVTKLSAEQPPKQIMSETRNSPVKSGSGDRDFKIALFGKEENNENHDTPPSLKSPRFKGKLSFGLRASSKKLDFGWLSRLNLDETKGEDSVQDTDVNNTTSTTTVNVFDESASCDQSENTNANTTADSEKNHNSSSDSMTFSDGNNSGGMDVDVETEAVEQKGSSTTVVGRCNENTDSGIGITSDSVFNSENVHEPVQEGLSEATDQNVTVSDADGALLYRFSEEASFPFVSDQDDDYEFGIDNSLVSDIINTLDNENLQFGEDGSSKSTHCESMESDYECPTTRKRSAAAAFSPSPSPSPEKKKRKFFDKSSRKNKKFDLFPKGKFSYKPPSPIKRASRKTKQDAEAAIKILMKKVTTSDKNSSQDVWTCSSVSETSPQNHTQDKQIEFAPDTIAKRNPEPKKKIVGSKANIKVGKKTKKSGLLQKNSKGNDNPEADKDDNNAEKVNRNGVIVDIFDEGQAPIMPSGSRKKFSRKRKPETLESKINSGKLDDNYVRIDLRKKRFVRGHVKRSVVKMKRLEWKQRKTLQGKEGSVSAATNSFTCHKCGEKGHFAKFCMKETVPEEAPGEEDESPLPTLEEAARMVYKDPNSKFGVNKVNVYVSNSTAGDLEDSVSCANDFDTACAPEQPEVIVPKLVETLEPLMDANSEVTEYEEQMLLEGLEMFGYSSFRPGQKEAICRVLKGLSTLLILSTGSGKSLCYQLPAYLYAKKYPGALTLCISPLVSLMEDQILGVPNFLNAACLHSNMTTKQKDAVLDKIKSKQLNILLVSPESVCGGMFGLLRGTWGSLPKISFACIDEVHCVSQWSHNFRPSYLQLCKILREKLNVNTILGLTATATKATANSICDHLCIDPSTTIRGELIPRNLKLSVSRDVYKDEALLNLLQGDRFKDCDSIIIYCTRREECERIATLVRTKLQTIALNKILKTKSGARLSSNCEAYHAGMTPRRRKNVQEGFMSGDIRIVVATVAFGMGIDKSDIRAVIHYNMPSAFESYVQEIGRAGRDGLPAHCHLFLDNAKRSDLNELKRHVYANSVDRPTIRKLLRKVFQGCKCRRIEKLRGNTKSMDDNDPIQCQGHEVSFAIEKSVTDLDLPKENITTLLCYLELDEKKWIEMLPLTYEKCKIQSYGGAKLIKSAAARCPPLAVAIALLKEKNKFRESEPYVEFNVIEVAATVGWSSSVVKRELKNLEWTGSQFDDKGNPIRYRKSGLLVEFVDLAYRVKSRGSLSDEEADEVLNALHNRNVHQEQTQIYQLHRVYEALLSVSFSNINNLCDSFDEEKSNELKKFIYEYFSEDSNITNFAEVMNASENQDKIEELRRTIRLLLASNRDTVFTTRAVARILQGISSPNFPADVWYKNREFWRKYLDVDFHFICRVAAEEM